MSFDLTCSFSCLLYSLKCAVLNFSVSFRLDVCFLVESAAGMIVEIARMKWVVSISLVIVFFFINLTLRCFHGLMMNMIT